MVNTRACLFLNLPCVGGVGGEIDQIFKGEAHETNVFEREGVPERTPSPIRSKKQKLFPQGLGPYSRA